MYRKFFLYIIFGIAELFIMLMPQYIFAAQIIFKEVSNNVNDNRVRIIEARIDPQSKNLNVVEGIINFQGTIADELSVEVETGGSILTIWPTPPKYLSSEKVIRFTGGVPNGFDHEDSLFIMRLSSPLSGNIIISWIDGAAYLNDGLGTIENIFSKPITVRLGYQKPAVSRYDWIKYLIIILILVIIFFIFRYGYKKIIKK